MISISKKIQLTGNGPWSYSWASSEGACTSFDVPTGTTTGIINVVISYDDSGCIDDAVITLTTINACGRSEVHTVAVDNPCSEVILNGPSSPSDLVFTAALASPGCTSATFVWTIDTTVFTKVSQVDTGLVSTLTVSLATSSPPTTTSVRVSTVDCKNCEASEVMTYTFCRPTPVPVTVNLFSTSGVYSNSLLTLNGPTGCATFEPDFTQASFSLPTGISASTVSAAGVVTFSAVTGKAAGTYAGTYYIKGENGVLSMPGVVTIVLSPISTGKTIVAANKIWTLECEDDPGDVVYLNIEDEIVVSSGSTIDWSTWQLITPPTPISSPAPSLTTNVQGKHVIAYTVPNPIVPDSFSWTVADTDGNYASAITYTVIDCVEGPTANDDEASVVCGVATEIDLLTNDQGNGSPLDPATVIIGTGPTYGTLIILSSGAAQYTSDLGFSGTDTFTYQVRNISGQLSNEATVTITVVCAGSDVNVGLCN